LSRLQRDLRASIGDGVFYSLMVGIGETYLAAFALALHVGEIATGLLVAVPMLAGSLLQLFCPALIPLIRSHRMWVVICAVGQAISLLAMPLAILCGNRAVVWLFFAAALYWGTGQATAPVWNAWMEELIPRSLRARFFASRSHVCQFGTLAGFVVGGLFLDYAQHHGFALAAFSLVLVVAAICRLLSAYCLSRHSDPPPRKSTQQHVGLRQIIQDLREHEGIKLCVYLFAVQVAVQIAAPYFSPFMLAHLKLSYSQFMILVALGLVGKIVALPAWGKLAHRSGARLLMWIGGVTIVPLSGLWFALHWIQQPFLYLAVLQVVGGIAWAAYELAFLLMFFETIPRHERISVLTLYNFGNASATAIGALIGGVGLAAMGEKPDAYLVLFTLSSICRLVALVFLSRVPRMQIEVVVPALRILSLRPSDDGGVDTPVLPTIPEPPGNSGG
jgi:MFS family permease